MKIKALFLFIVMAIFSSGPPCNAAVDLEILQDINIGITPVDVAVSNDGSWIYVLTSEAKMHVYSIQGTLQGMAPVEVGARQITCGPDDDTLCVTNRDRQTIQVLLLEGVHAFPPSHSPVKGPLRRSRNTDPVYKF